VPEVSRIGALTGWRPSLSLDALLDRLIAHLREESTGKPGGA
jgi:nucleoside-diphosphate-sugar epimerase